MDPGLLAAIVDEISDRLSEQEIQRVSHLGESRYLLRFATPDRDNLLISVRPRWPRLHLLPRGGGLPETPPDRLAALLDQELSGARLVSIETPAGDRLVRLAFRAPRSDGPPVDRGLVAELFGRSANLFLLDGAGIVLGWARDHGSVFRAPVAGRPYEPPAPRAAGPSGRHADAFPPEARGRGPVSVISRRPLADYRDGDRPGATDIRIVPGAGGALEGDPPTFVTTFPGPSAAAAAAIGLLERLEEFDSERERHRALVRREQARLATLQERLAQDLARARDGERHRRWAEALLAGLRAARVEGKTARVPDPGAMDGALLEVPIDPALTLQANAERHFTLWKKGKRGEAAVLARQQAVHQRLEAWTALLPRAEAVASAADLEALRQEMAALGLVHAAPRKERPGTPRRDPGPTRVRRHTTRDGHVILVGRSGPENDTLTFRVATPEDFWLHAAGQAGAHVIVRNPSRQKSIPEGTLRTAAAIAAWYSGARGEGKVEVHYTQRKHVHKRKGMPPGQVLVRRFRSILVTPGLPQGLEEV